jgi:hypothetical protein
VSAREIPGSISRETAFHRPTADPVELDAMRHYLADAPAARRARSGLKPRTIGLRLRYADGACRRGSRRPPAMSDRASIPSARRHRALASGCSRGACG